MTRRSYVRFLCYIAFALIALIALALLNTHNMNNYKAELEVSYRQSLNELSECVETIDTDLTKSLYSGSSGEIYDISRDLYTQCSTAKNAISRLPVSQMELGNAYKFLSQAADYSQYIGYKIEAGEKITSSEHKVLKSLINYADKLNTATTEMVNIAESGAKITNGEVKSTTNIKSTSLSTGFSSAATTFENFPTLLYDGPFSDQVLNKKSTLVESSNVCTKDECIKILSNALGITKNQISYSENESSKLPCYTYKCGRYTASVTKQGGYIKELLYSGTVENSNITADNAVNLASEFLQENNYEDMEPCYYYISDNICTVSFAYCKDNVYYYSDLIKCGVSMDDGTILTLDATTYLTNHTNRAAFSAKLTAEQCKANVSSYMTVNDVKQCVIPKSSGIEKNCYEFSCTSTETGEDALIYINCDTGEEEDIMLMIYSDNGTLVK